MNRFAVGKYLQGQRLIITAASAIVVPCSTSCAPAGDMEANGKVLAQELGCEVAA